MRFISKAVVRKVVENDDLSTFDADLNLTLIALHVISIHRDEEFDAPPILHKSFLASITNDGVGESR